MPEHVREKNSLIVLCDGTWNREDGKTITNIAKLYSELIVAKHLDQDEKRHQLSFFNRLNDQLNTVESLPFGTPDTTTSDKLKKIMTYLRGENKAFPLSNTPENAVFSKQLLATKQRLQQTLPNISNPLNTKQKLSLPELIENVLSCNALYQQAIIAHEKKIFKNRNPRGVLTDSWQALKRLITATLNLPQQMAQWLKRFYGEHVRKQYESPLVRQMQTNPQYQSPLTQDLAFIQQLQMLTALFATNETTGAVRSCIQEMKSHQETLATASASQKIYYDRGVGSWGTLAGYFTGATGKGLELNIRQAYAFFAKEYQPGDDLFVFGFSRGAYTVRSLLGMMHRLGLPPQEKVTNAFIQTIFTEYKQGDETSQNAFKKSHNMRPVQAKFLGAYDTVGAMGIPDADEHNQKTHGFHDTHVNGVDVARHALARDEHREDFAETRMKISRDKDIKQRWFPGAHSDIGGGYADHRLSDLARTWMCREAANAGLTLPAGLFPSGILPGHKFSITPNPSAPRHDSRYKFWGNPVRSDHTRVIGEKDEQDESLLKHIQPVA